MENGLNGCFYNKTLLIEYIRAESKANNCIGTNFFE